MVLLGDDHPPGAGGAVAGTVEHVQLVEPLEVEVERPAAAVDLDGEAVLAAGGHPGHLETGDRAGGGGQRRPGGVVDGHRFEPVVAGALVDERAQVAARRGHPLAEQVAHLVDDVRAQVAERPGAGALLAQPPGHRRGVVGEPVLEVRRPHLSDRADPAAGDQLTGQRQRRHPAVVEAHTRADPALRGGGRSRHHRRALVDRVGQRLLDQHVLARLERGDRDLGVAVAGGADVDDVDVVALDHRVPVGGRLGPAVAGRDLLDRLLVAADQHLLAHRRRVVERADVAPRVGVGLAHERVADHGDSERSTGAVRHTGLSGIGARRGPGRRGRPRAAARWRRPPRSRRCPG